MKKCEKKNFVKYNKLTNGKHIKQLSAYDKKLHMLNLEN